MNIKHINGQKLLNAVSIIVLTAAALIALYDRFGKDHNPFECQRCRKQKEHE